MKRRGTDRCVMDPFIVFYNATEPAMLFLSNTIVAVLIGCFFHGEFSTSRSRFTAAHRS